MVTSGLINRLIVGIGKLLSNELTAAILGWGRNYLNDVEGLYKRQINGSIEISMLADILNTL